MVSTIKSFTAGDLVVSLSGDADSGTTYYDNQGTPLTLEELTTSGTVVGQFVLPQTTTTTANGTVESAISAEYGSSSEGTLELSGDGQSLVIAGYGVNAATFNTAEAGHQPTNTSEAYNKSTAAGGPYGSASLAQTYSVPTGNTNGAPQGDYVTPRVIADISYNGTVDTSTSLINVSNENNPRSVATTNGTTFYLSGQGKKGDTTQGVFEATDGQNGTTPTPIYTGVDTRTAELYNGTLYVSEDSSINPGTGGIYSYGPAPTGATTPTALPGMTGSVTLTAGQGNNVNGSSGTVDLSPENFFFANSNTLYIADSGNPKGGTLGDGGLQKWSLNTSTNSWNLDYTVSSGLNLVPNTTALPTASGYGVDATTGLIGLTGKVNVDGTVSLYATNAAVGDLCNTYVYGATDVLANTDPTVGSSESFTQLFQAPADTNVRGIAFAPQAPVCFASGTLIRTTRGDLPVEALSVGDRVVTASGQHRPIRWLGHRTIDCRRHADPIKVMPVRVAANALGVSKPARDLYVSPGHSICLDVVGEVLIPASALINGATVTQVEVEEVTYWHVELDSHDVILAENLAAESYLDMGNRTFFTEGNVVRLGMAPDADTAQRSRAKYCRPYHDGGPLIEAVRAQMRTRADSLGWRLTQTLDVHLEVNGRRVDPAIGEQSARFLLPAEAKDVWIVSPAARPHDTRGAFDWRDLGIDIKAIRVEDGFGPPQDIPTDDPRLDEGFHSIEDGAHRWTNGRAKLPAELWENCRDAFFLRLDLGGPPVARWVEPAIGVETSAQPPQTRVLSKTL